MDETWLQGVAFLALLAALPLVVVGTTQAIDVLWWLGLVLLVTGGVIPLITRYTGSEDENDEDMDEPAEDDAA
jgi:lysylphosphatidylglycerol synthetase-like protein (DUF2156 family)